jgi:hypothetical protein
MRYHRPAPAPVAVAGASGGIGGEHPTATLKIQNPRYLLTVLVTWRIESRPPCRRVTDTSSHHCGKTVSLLLVFIFAIVAFHQTFSTFAPWRLASIIQFITVHCSVHCPSLLYVIAFCHCLSSLLSSLLSAVSSSKFFMAILNASLSAACTVSGFHFVPPNFFPPI